MCRNNGIGLKGQLPWSIPSDLKYFREITKGDGNNVVIMGNKTWQSLPIVKGKPRGLPSRDNFVLSRTDQFDMAVNHTHLLKTFKSIAEIESYIENNTIYEDVWVIGGAQIYKQFLDQNKIKKCYITYIDADFDCDTFFPLLDSTEWKQVERSETYDTLYECDVNYVILERI
jgi:dihydrofolate reductase